ncbi:MAG: dolichol-phosphate mannosyltransferase [Flavobacteriaceae bacterium]|nr:MAG: dolichol-phosphate mannosyltransferase [Flavobacteriaceae bacterium]
MKPYQFTVIIPVYNEVDNLLRVEQEMLAFIKVAIKKTTVLFINDGSNDGSLKMIVEICKRNSDFQYVSFDKNYGLSTALSAGFHQCKTEFLGYIDSDLQTSPSDFNLLLEHASDYDLITGVRRNRKDTLIKKTSSLIANNIRKVFTHDGMEDTGCPLKVIKTASAKNIPMFKGLHRFLPAMILLQNGQIKQVTVQHFPRIAGEAKYGVWNRLAGPLTDCFAYLWMKKKYINYTLETTSNE